METLRVEHVKKQFNDFLAVNDVSFSVESGEFLTLLGPSGCGKTTLLKLIGGFYPPSEGRIFIKGNDITKEPPERRDTNMCFQSYALFPHLTVSDNVTFGLKQQKIPIEEQQIRLRTVSEQVDLYTQLKKYPSMLSGGQQQRVALARALVMRSGIILFDEPLSNLDAKLRERVRIEIRRLQKIHGFTAVYVTHDQSEALALSDHIIVMNKGKIEQQGSPKEIYTNPVNSFIADFIGTANILEAEYIREEKNGLYQFHSQMGNLFIKSLKKPPAKFCRIAWRPEDVLLNPEKGSENSFRFKVETTVYQGNLIDIFIRKDKEDSKEFRIQVSRDTIYHSGEQIYFTIPPENFKFLEAIE